MGEAENRGIDFYIEVKSDLDGLQVEDWELCKVLANLLDNAMTALEGKEGERKILLDISEDSEQYRFSVCNNGPEIPISMREEIFKQGISTKKEEGHGMGLFIVMSVLKGYEGTMKLRSEEGETEFLFTLPKKKEDEGWNH
jgi:sensor histidine kinase regulating citrate/malate metabolism